MGITITITITINITIISTITITITITNTIPSTNTIGFRAGTCAAFSHSLLLLLEYLFLPLMLLLSLQDVWFLRGTLASRPSFLKKMGYSQNSGPFLAIVYMTGSDI